MASGEPSLRIGGQMSEHYADHGKTEVPLSLELLSNGEPTTHTISGEMLAGMLGVHSTSQMNVTGIEVKGSQSDFDGNLAVSMHQVDPDDPTVLHPLPNTERHMFAKSVGENATALVAAHAIVAKGSMSSNLHHKFDERIPHDGPQFAVPASDASLAVKKSEWSKHYGTDSEKLLKAPGITTAVQGTEHRAAISLNSAYADSSALCALAQKHQDNPEVLKTIFSGSSGTPVKLVNIQSGVEEPHIVCDMAAATVAAEHLSENLKHPYLHGGIQIKTHVASGLPTDKNNATLHLVFKRQAGGIDGEMSGAPLTKHAVDSAAGKTPVVPASVMSNAAAKAKFAEGLFGAPMAPSAAPAVTKMDAAPTIIDPIVSGGGAVDGGDSDDESA